MEEEYSIQNQFNELQLDPHNLSVIIPPQDEDPWASVDSIANNALLEMIVFPKEYDTIWCFVSAGRENISIESLYNVMDDGGLTHQAAMEVKNIVADESNTITKHKFHTALALIAIAQNDLAISLETIHQMRHDLPIPVLHDNSVTTNPLANNGLDRTPSSSGNTIVDETPIPATTAAENKARTTQGYRWFLELERVTVMLAPEKEGYIFKHVNYVIKSQLRGSQVLRRFSDFYWLRYMLQRRFPFRLLPSLPPKKMGGDATFLEERRRGLVRFINGVVQHPVLSSDDLVEAFMVWPDFQHARQGHTELSSTEDEFVRTLPDIKKLESKIPCDLDDRIKRIKKRLERSMQQYDIMCSSMERIIRREEAQATEFVRFSITLNMLQDQERQCHPFESGICQVCDQAGQDQVAVAKQMRRTGSLIDDQALTATDGILENLKRQRDMCYSFMEMLARKDRMMAAEKRISKKTAANMIKTNEEHGQVRTADEVNMLLHSEHARVVLQRQRETFTRYCIASELENFHKQQAFVSFLYQNYVHQQAQFTQRLNDIWNTQQSQPKSPTPIE